MVIFVLFQKPMEVDVQKNRFIMRIRKVSMAKLAVLLVAAAAAITVVIPSPALASGDLGSTSAAERDGCLGTGYDQGNGGTWALRYGGTAYQGIGYIRIRTRQSPSDPNKVRVCAVTWHGTTTWDKYRITAVEVGSQPKGGGTQDLYFWDRANYARYTEGRAITPGSGRCAVIHATIVSADGTKTYSVWVNQFDVPDAWFCN
jgi:hypothetical protein